MRAVGGIGLVGDAKKKNHIIGIQRVFFSHHPIIPLS